MSDRLAERYGRWIAATRHHYLSHRRQLRFDTPIISQIKATIDITTWLARDKTIRAAGVRVGNY